MTTNEIIGCVTMLVAVVGLIFSCYQWWKKVQLERAERLSKLINMLKKDELLKTLYMIDYSEFQYDENFHNSDNEAKIDKFLYLCEYILYLRNNNIIREKEFLFFEYDINRIIKNTGIQSYLSYLEKLSKTREESVVYKNILDYAKKEREKNQSCDSKGI